MPIPYPDSEQIHAAAEEICDRTLPKKETICSFLHSMTESLGFRYIFRGTLDVTLGTLGIFCFAGASALADLTRDTQGATKAIAFAFAFSPLLFILFFVLSIWKEKESEWFELKMTYKYTVLHLLAYRMFVVSIASVVLDGLYILLLSHYLRFSAYTAVCVSFSALFLFALMLLQTVLHCRTVTPIVVLCAAWLLVNALLSGLLLEPFVSFLLAVPVAVWVLVIGLLAGLLAQSYRVYVRRLCGAYS